MKPVSEEIEVVPEVPVSSARLTLVAILAALLGVSLTLFVAGLWLHYQQRSAWLVQVQALSETVQQKDAALADLRAQNASLAKHLKLLKEYSIARSTTEGGRATPADAASSLTSAGNATTAATVAPSAAPRASAAGNAKKAKAQDCDLVGKTPEQQAATLQRCVLHYETPAAKPRQ